MQIDDNRFKKYDSGKPNMYYVPLKALEGVSQVIDYGAIKYGRNNWKSCKPEETDRLLSAVLRHLTAIQEGEDLDLESGLPHIDHMITSLLFYKYINYIKENNNNNNG